MRTDGVNPRKHALIVLAAIVVGSLALGGASAALDRILRSGEESITGGSADRPDRKATASEPAHSPTTKPTPTLRELRSVTAALTSAGYACYESLTEPVVVHSCYLEPGSSSLDEQTARIQTAPDGSVAVVDLSIDYFDNPAASLKLFRTTVEALDGTILKAGEARAIVDGRDKDRAPDTPGTHSSSRLSWGTSALFVSEPRDAYQLELVAHGAKPRVIPSGDTEAGIVETREHYTGQGFRCTLDRKLQALKCQRRVPDAVYTIFAIDPCLGRGEKYELICKGRQATEISASVGFGAGLSDKQYEDLLAFLLQSADHSMGGMTVQARRWFLQSISDAKVHRADFQRMHVDFEPGAGAHEEFPNSVSVTVRGLNFST
ncbi:hypothetical protein ABN028_15070 [Actinopolymorpha sp. B17G11]|uniref:hypothetical protein n=1 Tax=Actinopolymorpha sp. B17G11 TaxID=3160861 RepID=UPI0032E4B4D0